MFTLKTFLRTTGIATIASSCVRRHFRGKQRPQQIIKRTWQSPEASSDLIVDALRDIDHQTVTDRNWSSIRKKLLESTADTKFNLNNIDSKVMGYFTSLNKYDLALSYIRYLQNVEEIKLNLATVGKYLKVLYLKNKEKCPLDAKCEEKILDMYDNLKSTYPALDSITLENVILAVSLTNEWKTCLDILKEIKISSEPTVISYSATAAAAFRHGHEDIAWELLREIIGNDRLPTADSFIAYLERINLSMKKECVLEKIEKLLEFHQKHNLKCQQTVVNTVVNIAKKMECKEKNTKINHRGVCRNCGTFLDKLTLTDDEFSTLKRNFLQKAIIGKDVFIKTNPDELEKFQQFIDKMKSVDVVLDGLNVAYSAGIRKSPHVYSALVAAVVSHFVEQNKSVLVLGRSHMNRWPKFNWNYVTQNANVFLTQDISQDDPYLLYCALNSGKDTIMVSRDLMRTHRFLLKDAHLKTLFSRWLAEHQYQLMHVNEQGKPIFKVPLPYSVIPQKKGCSWHIPYENEKNSEDTNWLCLQLY